MESLPIIHRIAMRSLLRPICLVLTPCVGAQTPALHTLTVELFPSEHRLEVHDTIEVPANATQQTDWILTLHPGLTIVESSPTLTLVPNGNPEVANYRLEGGLPSDHRIRVHYSGTLNEELSDASEEYTRGFRETDGIVGPQGVYLGGESHWVPRLNDALFRFEVEVIAPGNWHVISQGEGTSRAEDAPEGKSRAKWRSARPMEQVYLVGGPLHRYQDSSPPTETLVYLHADEPGLANKYLLATDRYLKMYRELLGNYPYTKFALVENFWETGYGMPSFTLLGEKVIRMPFILHSSYPHEILHNWWGNSVYVDSSKGNWCEGLTAYLSDHLVQEQRGKGAEYRRNTLQKYRDYVREGRDFPLQEFQSRHDAATEAVGYGKSLMLFHMLRMQFGEGTFLDGLRAFYKKFINRRASFADLRSSFEGPAGQSLEAWFGQWLGRTGAPTLALQDVRVEPSDDGYLVRATLVQTQAQEAYEVLVPMAIQTVGAPLRFTVTMQTKRMEIRRGTKELPTALIADPDFDVFRLLDPLETPPTIGQIFGDPEILAVLPSTEPALRARYQALVEGWQTPNHRVRFVLDSELSAWPSDQSVWILGAENSWVEKLKELGDGARWLSNGEGLLLAGETVASADHSTVCLWRNPNQAERVIGWLVVDPIEAFDGIQTKLPHYGKYSYLAFEGSEPTNVVKGQWNTTGSPLEVDLRTDPTVPLAPLEPELRVALVAMPPAFSTQRMLRDVQFLADPAREGRGLGSAGLLASGEYIAGRMRDMGLEPGGNDGSWFQPFTVEKGPDGKPVQTRNVVGILRGTRWPEQSIVLGAHYDHLGMGWPEARQGAENTLHPGADDNASGVAVMLELASNLVSEGAMGRSLVVVAFSAEEAGLFGSRFYCEQPSLPLEGLRAAINLDTVGRLGGGKISVHASGTADEWQHIFRGAGFVTGIPNQMVPTMVEGSDQVSFLAKGIPAVQLFTGAHADYHSPRDTIDRVDVRGLAKVAEFTKEAVTYLLDREEPLHVTIAGFGASKTNDPPQGDPTGRRVSFGSMPDFQYGGPGVRLESVGKNSPAEKAGLLAGDILVEIDGVEIADLKAFSEFLKTLRPDQTVQAVVQRGAEEITASVTVIAR